MRAITVGFCAAALLLGALVPPPSAAADPRQTINLNLSWRFLLGDYPGAENPSYDDSAWHLVGLPHSFSLPYFMSPQFYTGYGWYRKHFTVPASWAGRRVFVEFQAAFQDAQVGKILGLAARERAVYLLPVGRES